MPAESAAREAAERERDLLSCILEQSGEGIIVADASGAIRVFHSEARRQHGVALTAAPPEQWPEAYGLRRIDGSPIPLAELPLYRALRGEKVERARWLVDRPDGSTRILSGSAAPVRARGGEGLPPDVPRFVALTGYGLARDAERTLQAGFEEHHVKPVSPLRLLEWIARGPPGAASRQRPSR